jgi:hypothetical protein
MVEKTNNIFSRGYYIKDDRIHTVVNVRNIKQYLIDGKCPENVNICKELQERFLLYKTAQFLRLKYAVHNALRENVKCKSIRIKDSDIRHHSFMNDNALIGLGSKMGFKITIEDGRDDKDDKDKQDKNLLIEWNSTTQFDGSLLKTDPRYPLLQYKKKLDLIF